MDKREKIREGILDWVEGQAERNIRDNDPKWIEEFCQYLHDNDVVIKVEGKFPEPSAKVGGYFNAGFYDCKLSVLKAGYTLTEPLVEE